MIERLLEDPEAASLDARLKTLLGFVRKLMATPGEMSQADADAVLEAGGIEIPDEQEDELEKFREFLDTISPEDFAAEE